MVTAKIQNHKLQKVILSLQYPEKWDKSQQQNPQSKVDEPLAQQHKKFSFIEHGDLKDVCCLVFEN
jgi:hypothetical protein